jgi:hypothetical protein
MLISNIILIYPLPIKYGGLDNQCIKYVDLNDLLVRDNRGAGLLGNSGLKLLFVGKFLRG